MDDDDLPARHPAVAHLLRFFAYEHLQPAQELIAAPFSDLARRLANNPELDGPELTVALRKLLEAKDCAVRASL